MPPETFGQQLAEARRTPWKALNELRRIATRPAAHAWFAMHGIAWHRSWRIYGLPVIQRYRPSRITIGDGLEMRNWPASNPLGLAHPCILATWAANAVLTIGAEVGMSGVAICASRAITIGRGVVLGAGCVIVDTDFHPLDPSRRSDPAAAAPVLIEDDVFIGMRATILKGSRIGRGAVIGAASVVTGDIPAGVVAAGNPARVVRHLAHDARTPDAP